MAEPRMMPGETAYTEDELAILRAWVYDAATGDPGEEHEPRPLPHRSDLHCTVDPRTGLCVVCGVHHGEPCPDCGGVAYHRDTCREVTP